MRRRAKNIYKMMAHFTKVWDDVVLGRTLWQMVIEWQSQVFTI
jgi:hypothetical protein